MTMYIANAKVMKYGDTHVLGYQCVSARVCKHVEYGGDNHYQFALMSKVSELIVLLKC